MQIPVDVHFRHHLPHSQALEDEVHEHVEKLETYFDRITSCRVVIDSPHRHHTNGRIYHVDIEVAVPGQTLTVNRAHEADHAHENLHVAVRDAFHAMRRKVRQYAERIRERA